jgi:hypothetical protein
VVKINNGFSLLKMLYKQSHIKRLLEILLDFECTQCTVVTLKRINFYLFVSDLTSLSVAQAL